VPDTTQKVEGKQNCSRAAGNMPVDISF